MLQYCPVACRFSRAWVAITWIDGMTDVLHVILLLATLIWTIVKIAQAIKDFHGDCGGVLGYFRSSAGGLYSRC